jgi:DNA repair protein RadC
LRGYPYSDGRLFDVGSPAAANQRNEDVNELAGLISAFTGIQTDILEDFICERGAQYITAGALNICQTQEQREKLANLFKFKNLFDAVRSDDRCYTLSDAEHAKDFFKNILRDSRDKEYFFAAFLDAQCQVIKAKSMFEGTVSGTAVYVREIVKEALFCNAAIVIVAHNHPSGSLRPSKEDIDVTTRCRIALQSVGIGLLDHIIVAGYNAVSCAEQGFMERDGIPANIIETPAWEAMAVLEAEDEDEDEWEM